LSSRINYDEIKDLVSKNNKIPIVDHIPIGAEKYTTKLRPGLRTSWKQSKYGYWE